ncbi:hypothetical protein HDU77_008547 [Chytriomyces hyalinus]|nr:hypothetical protein HDU77_008547 [Chytriomyces hyalinus]
MTALLFPSISASDDALLSSTDGTKRKFFSNDFPTNGLSSADTVRSVRRIRQESDVEMNLSTASDTLSTENEPHFYNDENQNDDSCCDPQLPVSDQCESVDGFSLYSATYSGSPSASSPCPSPTSSTTATISLQYEDSLYAFAFSSTLVENDDFNTWDDSFLQAPLIDFVSQLKNAFEVEDDVFVEFPQLELVFAEDSTYCEQFCLEHLMALCSPFRMNLTAFQEPNILFITVGAAVECYALQGSGIFSLVKMMSVSKLRLESSNNIINAIKSGFLGNVPVLVTVDDGGLVAVHETEFLTNPDCPRKTHLFVNGESTWGLDIHAESRLVAVSANSHVISIFNLGMNSSSDKDALSDDAPMSGFKTKRLSGHENNIPNIRFSSCGRYIASCSIDSSVRVWNIKTSQTVAIFKNNQTNDWNWSVNFIRPQAFRSGVDQKRSWEEQSYLPSWCLGVPQVLKPKLVNLSWRRGPETDPLLTTFTTTVVHNQRSDDETAQETASTFCSDDEESEHGSQDQNFGDMEANILTESVLSHSHESDSHSIEDNYLDAEMAFASRNDSTEFLDFQTPMSETSDDGALWDNGPDITNGNQMNDDSDAGHWGISINEVEGTDDEALWEDADNDPDIADGNQMSDDSDADHWGDTNEVEGTEDEEMSSDESLVDSETFWRRPITQKTIHSKIIDTEAAASMDAFILCASVTDVWAVDMATGKIACKLEGVFSRVQFGRTRILNRISIHEYIPELGIILALSQAGALAVIRLLKHCHEDQTTHYDMTIDRIIQRPEPAPYLGMVVRLMQNVTTGRQFAQLFLCAFDATVVLYEIRQPENSLVDVLYLDSLHL